MGADLVVMPPPSLNGPASLGQTGEPVLVETFIPELAVDGEDGPAPENGPYVGLTSSRGATMMTPTTVGLGLAKNVFHIHVTDASSTTIDSKRLARRELLPFFRTLPNCLVGVEACATAHNWARRLQCFGHDVWLIPPG